jgi:hypothetical protein
MLNMDCRPVCPSIYAERRGKEVSGLWKGFGMTEDVVDSIRLHPIFIVHYFLFARVIPFPFGREERRERK